MTPLVYLSLAMALASGPTETQLAAVDILPEWFANDGDSIRVTLTGHYTVDAAVKQVAAWFGKARVAILPSPAAAVQGGWQVVILITRVSASEQWASATGMVSSQAVRALGATPDEDLSGPVPLVVTGYGGALLRVVMIERLAVP